MSGSDFVSANKRKQDFISRWSIKIHNMSNAPIVPYNISSILEDNAAVLCYTIFNSLIRSCSYITLYKGLANVTLALRKCCKVYLVCEILDASYILTFFLLFFFTDISITFQRGRVTFNWKEGNVMRLFSFERIFSPSKCLCSMWETCFVKKTFFLCLWKIFMVIPNYLITWWASCLPSSPQIPSGSFRLHPLDSTTEGPPTICQIHSEEI